MLAIQAIVGGYASFWMSPLHAFLGTTVAAALAACSVDHFMVDHVQRRTIFEAQFPYWLAHPLEYLFSWFFLSALLFPVGFAAPLFLPFVPLAACAYFVKFFNAANRKTKQTKQTKTQTQSQTQSQASSNDDWQKTSKSRTFENSSAIRFKYTNTFLALQCKK